MNRKQLAIPIAVIGLGCWYPESRSPRQLWENILSRRRQFRRIPDCRLPLADYYHEDLKVPDKTYARLAAVIDGFVFDWAAKRIPFSTYEATDLVHWLALETALQAVADAGLNRSKLPSRRTGVIVGNSLTGEQTRSNSMRLRWPFIRKVFLAAARHCEMPFTEISKLEDTLEGFYKSVFPATNEDTLAGGLSNTIAGRICNHLNTNGGGYTVDGACSSSLLAIATAATGLSAGDLDLALAGGVDISLDPFELIGFSKTNALTPGDMTVYDRSGSGFIPGEGCGFVVLKRHEDALRDHNYIYAVLHGWGISSDGGNAALTAPSVSGQVLALKRAYAKAGYGIHDLHFIEGHGTGTAVGDRIELEAIAALHNSNRAPQASKPLRACGITSLKSIIGHTKAASGVGGFIKAVMAVNRRICPPTAGCRHPNPVFENEARGIYPIQLGTRFEPTANLKAGISAMGFGGINCHVTIASADPPSPALEPAIEEQALMASAQEDEIFILSGSNPSEVMAKSQTLLAAVQGISLAEVPDFAADLAHQVDSRHRFRAAFTAVQPDDIQQKLQKLTSLASNQSIKPGAFYQDAAAGIWVGYSVGPPRIGLLFPGQGSQKLNMAQTLVARFNWAREIVQTADLLSQEYMTTPLSKTIFSPIDQAKDPEQVEAWFRTLSLTANAQPAICLASILWYRFLKELGIVPAAAGGHSLGEATAFYAAGAFDETDLLRFAFLRGQAMMQPQKESGAMLSLNCSRSQVEALLENISEGYAVLANLNAPNQMIVSGDIPAIEQLLRSAGAQGIPARLLPVSNAFHCQMMAPATEKLARKMMLPTVLAQPEMRLFRGTDGKEVFAGYHLPDHFLQQVTAQVHFMALVASMAKCADVIIEVGPGQVLTGLVNAINRENGPVCAPTESTPLQTSDLNQLLARLFANGATINWEALYAGRLVRPFVPSQDKSFFINPCEKPLVEGIDGQPAAETQHLLPADLLLSELPDLSQKTLQAYLKKRGSFLSEVIKADLKHSMADEKLAKQPIDPHVVRDSEMTAEERSSLLPLADVERFYHMIVKATGFPRETLTPDLRLLDDLNLDSIKSGDLIAGYAELCGLSEQVDPAALANASIRELTDLFDHLQSLPKRGEREDPGIRRRDILQEIVQQVNRITGISKQDVSSDALIGPDLKFSADQLEDLLQGVSAKFNLDLNIDTPSLLERSLNQLADIMVRIAEVGNSTAIAPGMILPYPWVREFRFDLIEKAQSDLPSWFGKRAEDQWQNAQVLILSDDTQDDVCRALGDQLNELGAAVGIHSYDAAASGYFADRVDGFSHFIAVLPRTPKGKIPTADDLASIIRRLSCATLLSPANRGRRRCNCLTYVQFGGGFFGTRSKWADLSQCCATALAKSVYLERRDLKTRVIDFDPAMAADIIAAKILSEMQGPDGFIEVGYDRLLTRRTRVASPLQPAEYAIDKTSWSKNDVILVTGGAKGITAECALALARTIGTRMALVGRTQLGGLTEPDPQANTIGRLLQRYDQEGLEARYYSCDVCDRDSLKATLTQIQQDLGEISGVIHGAGLNIPRRITQTTAADALNEVSPKVLGILNLLAELKKVPPKLIVGLTSIIGVSGMAGNSWYAFSNEALDLVLRRFGADHPQTRTLSVAYSIWRDEGMGAKLGSVAALEKKGVEALSTEEGVKRFVHLVQHDPPAHQVIVSARTARIETLAMQPATSVKGARFLETLIQHTPGVESVFLAHLSHGEDLYLQDHCFNGSFLFPTVFGLEAMAQAVAHVSGVQAFGQLRIENLRLQRPITVGPDKGTEIIIYALVQERRLNDNHLRVKAGIFKLGSDSQPDFFSAQFVLGVTDEPAADPMDRRRQQLDIQPTDLYRRRLLFQGPRFQRISKVHQLERRENGSGTVEVSTSPCEVDPAELAFANPARRKLLLGDPFQRDALLQTAALMIPQDTSLPVSIERWDIHLPEQDPLLPGRLYIQSRLIAQGDKAVTTTVRCMGDAGDRLENLAGYRLRILQHREEYPTVADLLDPDDHDTAALQKYLSRLGEQINFKFPEVGVAFLPGIHDLGQNQRRELERPLLERVVKKATGHKQKNLKDGRVDISWQPSGQPVALLSDGTIEVSLAHDQRYCMAAAADRILGCDIAPVGHRSLEHWIGLLGPESRPLIDESLAADDLDLRCTALWAAREVLQKTGIQTVKSISVEKESENATVFHCHTDEGERKIVAFPFLFTRGSIRVIALSVEDSGVQMAAKDMPGVNYPGYEALLSPHPYQILEDGPQGQVTFIYRFPVTFHPAGQLSRRIYFSHYFFWAGMVREASAWPVLDRISNQFTTGKWGGVTNFADLKIRGEATTHDLIEVWMWASGNGGPQNSVLDLTYDFRKVLPAGGYERLAWLEQQTTWVRILANGEARVEPYPDYYASFLQDMLPRYEAPNLPQSLPEPLGALIEEDNDPYLYISPTGPVVEPLVHSQIIETSLADANIVGNIYFANYYAWQGRVRDRYFYSLVPECFQGTGKSGELVCLTCRVDHLREAMPFDRIEVRMSLKALKPSRATFHFDYFKSNPPNRHLKLAAGEQTVVWVRRDANNLPQPHPFPSAVHTALKKLYSQQMLRVASG